MRLSFHGSPKLLSFVYLAKSDQCTLQLQTNAQLVRRQHGVRGSVDRAEGEHQKIQLVLGVR